MGCQEDFLRWLELDLGMVINLTSTRTQGKDGAHPCYLLPTLLVNRW